MKPWEVKWGLRETTVVVNVQSLVSSEDQFPVPMKWLDFTQHETLWPSLLYWDHLWEDGASHTQADTLLSKLFRTRSMWDCGSLGIWDYFHISITWHTLRRWGAHKTVRSIFHVCLTVWRWRSAALYGACAWTVTDRMRPGVQLSPCDAVSTQQY